MALAPVDDTPQLPQSLDSEQAILGALLFEKTLLQDLEADLRPEHFYEPFHGRLFRAMRETIDAGLTIEVFTLAQEFLIDPAFKELGGVRYLADLVDRAPPAANAPEYARLIIELWSRRELVRIGEDIARRARLGVDDNFHRMKFDAAKIVASADAALMELSTGALADDANLVDARTAAEQYVEQLKEDSELGVTKGVMTGLRCVDHRLNGLKEGNLIILGGRPSMGKSGLARTMMQGAASRNPRRDFAFFGIEMTRGELIERTMSELTHTKPDGGDGIAYQDLTPEKVTPFEIGRLRELTLEIPRNLYIDDSPVISVEKVRRRVWAMKRRGDLAAVAIDYLQIMERPHNPNGVNEASLLGQMTGGLKRLAREAKICIVLLSQVGRDVDKREDKRPHLADLRESGAIEQDANAVLFTFRPVYYLEREEPAEGSTKHDTWVTDVEALRRRMDVICGKNRGGHVGTDRQEYLAEFDHIRNAWQGVS